MEKLNKLEQLLQLAQALLREIKAELNAQTSSPSPTRRGLPWGKKVSQTFKDRVFWIEDTLGIKAEHLMAVMAFESARTFSANVKNPGSSAVGLIQFMASTAAALGTSSKALMQMTPEDQLNYVYKYFAQWGKGKLKSLGDVYMAVLDPRGIGKADDFALWVRGDSAYAVNSGLDINKDHIITKGEALEKVQAAFVEGTKEENFG